MDLDKVLTAIAGALVLLPTAVPAMVPEAAADPRLLAALAMLSLIGAAILKQSAPAGKSEPEPMAPLLDADVKRIAREIVRVQRSVERVERARVAAAERG